MARIARVVIPGTTHLLTQRGNRGNNVFLTDKDYQTYAQWLNEAAAQAGLAIWAYCLMPNHVHFLVCPGATDSIRSAFAETHRRYTRHINQRMKWTGHLWQERFSSFPIAPEHVPEVIRYVEMNPLRARLAKKASEWPWSSARTHLHKGDSLFHMSPSLEWSQDHLWQGSDSLCPPKSDHLAKAEIDKQVTRIRRHIRSGRPMGQQGFISHCETVTGRSLARRKPGPKPGRKRAASSQAPSPVYSDAPLPASLL